ncbi:hypothetical protein [Acholeplasma granularum]|uniref:hypothetical protein n=1 Tax=Acholeplasma granularum TaxID=264635 RepID=UPI0004721F99|nr:hypothetical protein [Acholeplasma granularum]
MTEAKNYKNWVETEYVKKKQPTVDALRSLSVEDLNEHIKQYKQYILSLVMDHEQEIHDGKLTKQAEKQLRQIHELETFLNEGLTNALIQIMLDEDIMLHLIKRVQKDQEIGACCITHFE